MWVATLPFASTMPTWRTSRPLSPASERGQRLGRGAARLHQREARAGRTTGRRTTGSPPRPRPASAHGTARADREPVRLHGHAQLAGARGRAPRSSTCGRAAGARRAARSDGERAAPAWRPPRWTGMRAGPIMPEFRGCAKPGRRASNARGCKRGWMSKEDLIELQGVVTEVLAGGNYKVKCGENHEVLARLNGKMRQFRIRVIAGRPRDRRRLALRPQARPHHLPRQVAARPAGLQEPLARSRIPTERMDSPVAIPRDRRSRRWSSCAAEIPAAHPSAAILGEERMGAGVAVGADRVLTAHYLVLGASRRRGAPASTAGRATSRRITRRPRDGPRPAHARRGRRCAPAAARAERRSRARARPSSS